MRALILADVHYDFWWVDGRNPFEGSEAQFADLDLVLLAGDISNKPKVHWPRALAHLTQLIPAHKIALFPGNHDYYGFRLDGDARLAEIAAAQGATFAQDRQLTFGDIRFLCTTLWTDLDLGGGLLANAALLPSRMNDYRQIRIASEGYRRLRPADMRARHLQHRAWLTEALAQPVHGRTYVVTHHAPHPDVLTDRQGLDAAYASDLTDLIETYRPTAWFFGHNHRARSLRLGDTDLINVSLGYPDKVPDPAPLIQRAIHSF